MAAPAPGDAGAGTAQPLREQVEELKREAQAIQPLLDELYPELFPPSYVSEELTMAGGVAAGMYAAYKLLRIIPLGEHVFAHLRRGMLAAATIFIGWRITTGCVSRLVSAISGHRRRRRALLRRWQALTERIEKLGQAASALASAAAEPAVAPARAAEGAPAAAEAAAAPAGATPSAAATPAATATGAGASESAGTQGAVTYVEAAAIDSTLDSVDSSILGSSMDVEPAAPPPRQQPRASWGSGMAGWSQLYSARPAAAAAAAQQSAGAGAAGTAGAAGGGPEHPGGSPVMLPKPWDNGGESDEDWEEPRFARGGGS